MLALPDTKIVWEPPKAKRGKEKYVLKKDVLSGIVCNFIDTAATSFGRATHYNSREEQQKAEILAHRHMFELDRDLYALFLTLPGVTDRSSQMGLKALLSAPRNGDAGSIFDSRVERKILFHLVGNLPPQRVFKMFEGLRVGSEVDGLRKANNARTRKLILETILGSPKLELWSVKYRTKIRAALIHAWGQRKASIIRSILEKDTWSQKEHRIIGKNVTRYMNTDNVETARRKSACISFILGSDKALGGSFKVPLLKEFAAAKKDLKAGKRLPVEVLEGIRSTYHKAIPKEEILKIAADAGSLTRGQKLAVQKRAKAADVHVDMDPLHYDPVRLYIYAFEAGLTEAIIDALAEKAIRAAASFPVHYKRIGILVDASNSMIGDTTQKLRPMAAALAIRDMLGAASDSSVVVHCGGKVADQTSTLVYPEGSTSLAEAFTDLLTHVGLEAIFILSDGYENCPAGRLAEVVRQLKKIGKDIPVYHINPVFAAEVKGIKELAPNLVPTLPVQRPDAMGITFIRGLLEADPIRGINLLIGMSLPQLTEGGV